MPQLVVLAAIGAGLYAGSRILSFLAGQLQERGVGSGAGDHATGAIVAKDLGRLELDPATGVYRPSKS